MKIKYYVLIVVITLVSLFVSIESEAKTINVFSKTLYSIQNTNTFVRVLINDEWWIIEYDEDGGIVSIVKEPNY